MRARSLAPWNRSFAVRTSCGMALVLLAGCPTTSTGTEPEPDVAIAPDFDRSALLTSVADEAILPTLTEARDAIGALASAAALWRDERVAGRAGTLERASAQAAWRVAFAAWARADVMQIGPAGANGATKGGRGLRDEVNAWPTVSPCSVDQALVANTFEDEGYFASKLVNMRGLAALEHALFTTATTNACPAAAAINTSGEWAALDDEEQTTRRARFAAALAVDVAARASALVDAWTSGHRADFVKDGGGLYGTPAVAIDEVVTAMMFLDQVTKHLKLGVPLGLDPLCGATSCPESFEAPLARAARAGVVGNLEGVRALYEGGAASGDGIGFREFLVAAEADELASRLGDHLTAALAACDASPEDWAASVTTERAALLAVHDAVRVVADDIKNELVIVLDVSLPPAVGGDND